MAKKTEVKTEKAFGDFHSADEINRCAAGLKAEGDTESLKAMAEENGIEPDIVTLYLDGEIPELCDESTAAEGRIKTELNEIEGRETMTAEGIAAFLRSRLDDPNVCRAVMDGGHTLTGAAKKMWSEAEKNKTNQSYCMGPDKSIPFMEEYYGI